MNPTTPRRIVFPTRALRAASLIGLLGFAVAAAQAQANPTDPNTRRRGGERPERAERANRTERTEAGREGGGRGSFSPEDMQARLLSGLRDRMGIANDEEWGLISQRIAAVSDARRAIGGGLIGAFAGRGGPPPGGDRSRGGRSSSNPEMAALQQAIADNLPEAEIKSRLERMRETRRNAETKVAKAQEDLRAVLTIKQEAVAVMFGLLN